MTNVWNITLMKRDIAMRKHAINVTPKKTLILSLKQEDKFT